MTCWNDYWRLLRWIGAQLQGIGKVGAQVLGISAPWLFNGTLVSEYESWVKKFLESVLILMNVTSGQSGRGTEISSLTTSLPINLGKLLR